MVTKLNTDGTTVSGWPIEFGGSGDDVGYDIKEDKEGYYVIAGISQSTNFDLSEDPANTDGDFWVFKIDPGDGTLDKYSHSRTYSGPYTGTDRAWSLVVDCNGNGDYIISGSCKSCDPNQNQDEQLYLLRISSDFTLVADEAYGNIDEFKPWDYVSYDIIQTHHPTFGACNSNDGFLLLGLQHPGLLGACFDFNLHDLLAVKTNYLLANDAAFSIGCVNANGGYLDDNGWSAVQTCQGYLLAGTTKSSKNDEDQPCTGCQVDCNHYECGAAPKTEDIWLAMVPAADGDFASGWDESIGGAGNDGAHVIKRLYDGSYVVAGYTTNNGYSDFYVVKFELTAACGAPAGLSSSVNTYCATLS